LTRSSAPDIRIYPADRARLWTPGTELTPISRADGVKEINGPGKKVIIDYRVRREGKFTGSFDGEIVALSDGISNGGSVFFVVGDRTVNPAVEEMVRSLPPKVVRRAIVPARFDLDRGTRKTYPREEPPGTTYLEINLRSPFASNSVGVCEGSESVDSAYVASCICADGRAEGYDLFDGLGESEGMGYAAPGNRR